MGAILPLWKRVLVAGLCLLSISAFSYRSRPGVRSPATPDGPAPPYPASSYLGEGVDPPDSQRGKRRWLDFRYFPFVVRRVVPECMDDARCLPSVQCQALKGDPRGKCHNGFAVCCTLEAPCGSTVRVNETFLVNDNYPKPVTTLGHCHYVIDKMNRDICQLRLDFIALVLEGPDQTSRCQLDTFSVSSGTRSSPLLLCGTNSGQHMYVDVGDGSNSVRINIATTEEGFERLWKIKVTQIACDSRYKAPADCLQHFAGFSGAIKSFNYQDNDGAHQIGGLMYTACVQARAGFCGIAFRSDDFSMSNDGSSAVSGGGEGRALTGNADCTTDFISIFTASREGQVRPDRYCGNRLENITTFSKPFEVRVVTDLQEEGADRNNRGFMLHYVQIPC